MKMRLDFVTNSSSSSFVCFGVSKDEIKIGNKAYINLFNEYVNDNKGEDYFEFTDEELEKMTDEEKIDFVNDDGEIETNSLFENDIISIGGYDRDEVGIEPFVFIDKFPDEKIGDIKKITARELNKKFGTSFEEKDISYFESGWMDN